jgi:heavy metal translocating P-type ATPase
MLSDVKILLGVYAGARFFEHYYRKKNNKKGVQKIKNSQGFLKNTVVKNTLNTTPVKNRKNFRDNKVIDENEKAYDYHLKVSTANLAISAIRQFMYPVAIAPLHLALLSYTSFMLFKRAEKSLIKEKKIGNDVFASIFGLMGLAMSEYFALALGSWFYFVGCKVVAKTQNNSQQLLMNVFEQLPSMVWVLKNNIEIEMPLSKLQINDIVVVNTGEVIPIDGIITEGMAMIDQHALTGESQPAEKGIADKVLASTIVISGRIYVKVEKTGFETTFFKIHQLLNQSAQFKTKVQLRGEEWADKAAVPFLSLSLLTASLLSPLAGLVVLTGNFGNRIRILAPLGTLNYLKSAYQKGILIKDGRAIESLNKVDTILFDKTGTLTEKIPEVGEIILCDSYEKNELLTYAAAAERKVTHPIAKAILNKANESKLSLPDIDDSKYQVGYGITVSFKNKVIRVGSLRFMLKEGLSTPPKIEKAMAHSHNQGHSLVIVAVNQQIIGAIEVQAVVRPEVKQIISDLRRQHGIKHIAIVSGDHKQPTQTLAESLGMDSYFYNILPSEKANIVEQLQKKGRNVCFVGDGINDAIALKKANISISLTGASSIATDVAEVVLMDGTLSHLSELFEVSKNLDSHLRNSFMITLLPTVINIAGASLFNFGFMTAIVIKNGLFFVGVIHTMRPLKQTLNIEAKKTTQSVSQLALKKKKPVKEANPHKLAQSSDELIPIFK